jgi:Molybdopterin converting factor, large subunit
MEIDLVHDPRIACHVVDIADGPLDVRAAIDFVSDDAHGGIDVFIGRVRAASHGRQCIAIHYDMFDPLALNVFRAAAAAAVERFGPKAKCYVAHAKGRLIVAELAVVVAFGSPHRDESFRGCREVIEAVKHQAPIWKQEHFADGQSEWSEGCSLCDHGPASTIGADTHHGHAHHGHAHHDHAHDGHAHHDRGDVRT